MSELESTRERNSDFGTGRVKNVDWSGAIEKSEFIAVCLAEVNIDAVVRDLTALPPGMSDFVLERSLWAFRIAPVVFRDEFRR